MNITPIPQGDKLLAKCFDVRQREVLVAFANAIEEAIVEYDRVVLVARRALCLYRSLVACGLLEVSDESKVISSRALRMHSELLRCFRIAVFDDAALSGDSLARALREVRLFACKDALIDVYVSVTCPDVLNASSDNDCGLGRRLPLDERMSCVQGAHSFAVYERKQALDFCRSVIEFAQATGMGSNVDNPIYAGKVEGNAVSVVLAKLHRARLSAVNVSRPIHVANGIANYTVTFDSREIYSRANNLFPALADVTANQEPGLDLYRATYKARIQIDSRTGCVSIIPFVLLGPVRTDSIGEAFIRMFGESALREMLREDDTTGARSAGNELAVVSYALSVCLGDHFLQLLELPTVRRDLDLERMVFGHEVPVNKGTCDTGSFDLPSLDGSEVDFVALDAYVAHAKAFAQQSCTPLGEGSVACDATTCSLTYGSLSEYLSSYLAMTGQQIPHALVVSCVLDALIDEGNLVPHLVSERTQGSMWVQRGWRGGERMVLYDAAIDEIGRCLQCMGKDNRFKRLNRGFVNAIAILFYRLIDRTGTDESVDPSGFLSPGWVTFEPGEPTLTIPETADGVSGTAVCDMLCNRLYLAWDGKGMYSVSEDSCEKEPVRPPRSTLVANAFMSLCGNRNPNDEDVAHDLNLLLYGGYWSYGFSSLLPKVQGVIHLMGTAQRPAEDHRAAEEAAKYARDFCNFVGNFDELRQLLEARCDLNTKFWLGGMSRWSEDAATSGEWQSALLSDIRNWLSDVNTDNISFDSLRKRGLLLKDKLLSLRMKAGADGAYSLVCGRPLLIECESVDSLSSARMWAVAGDANRDDARLRAFWQSSVARDTNEGGAKIVVYLGEGTASVCVSLTDSLNDLRIGETVLMHPEGVTDTILKLLKSYADYVREGSRLLVWISRDGDTNEYERWRVLCKRHANAEFKAFDSGEYEESTVTLGGEDYRVDLIRICYSSMRQS